MSLKFYNKLILWIATFPFVLLMLTISVSAAEIDKQRVDNFDSDIVIAYEIPGYPETVYIGVIPDKVPYIGPDIDFYDREQMAYNVQSYFRAISKINKIPMPDSYSYTVIYKTDINKSYSDTIYASYTKDFLA